MALIWQPNEAAKRGWRSPRRWLLAGTAPVALALVILALCGPSGGDEPAATRPADVAGSGSGGLDLGQPPAPPGPPAAQPTAAAALSPVAAVPALAKSFTCQPVPGEFRGSWLHWEDYANPQAIARTVARASRAGLNALLPLANYPHQAMWRSRLLPTNPDVPAGFDPLRELAKAAHAAGIQVHPYLIMLHGGLTKHPCLRPEWFVVDRHGQRVNGWLNPAHPGVREFLCQIVAEVAATGVDGVSYDYIRHEYDTDYDYSEFTRRLFLAEKGFDPLALRSGVASGNGMRLLRTQYHQTEGRSLLAAQQAFLGQAGYRPALVEAENLAMLSRRTVLVAGNLYPGKVPPEQIARVLRFAREGGAVLILDGPVAVTDDATLADAVGLTGRTYADNVPMSLLAAAADHPVLAGVPASLALRVSGNLCQSAAGAQVLASFADGRPALAWKSYGEGTILSVNFHCYLGAAAESAAVQRLVANAVAWLGEKHGIVNTARTGLKPGSELVWDQWRVDQVTELVRRCSTAARAVKPDIVVSAAGGTRRTDLSEVRRDGRTWLARGYVNFLCPMAYNTDLGKFQKRIGDELAAVDDERLRGQIFGGIGAYKLEDNSQAVIDQVYAAREAGLKGVCLFAFENLTDAMVSRLGDGPFRQPATVPWRMAPSP
ncbi:MAG: family 10 glycosylhydrolase [Armatimonadetes bacterium]|nr:family 10 glycosylhydrolase [Armatimonadota bacterium]